MVAIKIIQECFSSDILLILNWKCNIKMKVIGDVSVGLLVVFLFVLFYQSFEYTLLDILGSYIVNTILIHWICIYICIVLELNIYIYSLSFSQIIVSLRLIKFKN